MYEVSCGVVGATSVLQARLSEPNECKSILGWVLHFKTADELEAEREFKCEKKCDHEDREGEEKITKGNCGDDFFIPFLPFFALFSSPSRPSWSSFSSFRGRFGQLDRLDWIGWEFLGRFFERFWWSLARRRVASF